MKVSIFPDQIALNAGPVLNAFVDSLVTDPNIEVVKNDISADVAVIWSLLWSGRMANNKKVWDIFRSQDKPVIVLEVGCLQRNITWKIGLNGVNRDAEFGNENSGDTRVNQLDLKLKPWKENGQYIIICCQHGASQQWRDMPSVQDWTLNIIDELKKHTNRKIIIRPHPRFKVIPKYNYNNVLIANPKHIAGTYDDFNFNEALENCWAVINYSSNPAIQAVLAGVPVFVSNHSYAYPMGHDINDLSKIETPVKPDRKQWLNNLSYTEWTVDEIREGLPWNRLKNYIRP